MGGGIFLCEQWYVTDEVIKEYIERHVDDMEEFTIEERDL